MYGGCERAAPPLVLSLEHLMDFFTHYRPKVYTASKLKHASMWRDLRSIWSSHVEFTARWPDLEDKLSDDECFAREFWRHDIQDIARADCVLVYAEPGEHLRGALVEAGAGIALGKHVVLVGEHPDYGTWQYHPMVTKVDSLGWARAAIIGTFRCQ
jgi:nucleoside 2-deoxyribosyltransferase